MCQRHFFMSWMSEHPQQAGSPTKNLRFPRATTILDTDGIPWLQLALGTHMAQMPDRYRIPHAEGRNLPIFYTACRIFPAKIIQHPGGISFPFCGQQKSCRRIVPGSFFHAVAGFNVSLSPCNPPVVCGWPFPVPGGSLQSNTQSLLRTVPASSGIRPRSRTAS